MSLDGLRVMIGRQNHVEACLLKAEAQPSCAAEKVGSQPGGRVASPEFLRKL
jgi:hypothetical protein